MTHLLCVGVNVNNEFTIYKCVAKGVAGIGMMGEIETSELPVGIVAVNLTVAMGCTWVEWTTEDGEDTHKADHLVASIGFCVYEEKDADAV